MLNEREKPPMSVTRPIELSVRPAKEFVTRNIAGIFLGRIDSRVAKTLEPEFADGFEDTFREAMKNKDTIPILISSHQGHPDGVTAAVLSKKLTGLANEVRDGKFPGFQLIIAASIRAGHQGLLLKEIAVQGEKDYLPRYHLRFLDLVRKKDVERYNMRPNTFPFIRGLINAIQAGHGLILFPEASVESGRRIKSGPNKNRIKGMQRFNGVDFDLIIEAVRKNHKKALFIPVGSHGAFNIVDPDHKRPPLKTIAALAIPVSQRLMTVKVGQPINYADLVNDLQQQGQEVTSENIGNFLGHRVAELLPPHARGVYA